MDVNTSPIFVTTFFTIEKKRDIAGIDQTYHMVRDWGIARIGDESEGFVMVGPPTQVVSSIGQFRGDDRIYEVRSPIPAASFEPSANDVATWAAMGQPLHYKVPTI